MNKRVAKLLLAFACLPLLQFASCSLVDGSFLWRTLSGTLLDPVANQAFQFFYELANSGA